MPRTRSSRSSKATRKRVAAVVVVCRPVFRPVAAGVVVCRPVFRPVAVVVFRPVAVVVFRPVAVVDFRPVAVVVFRPGAVVLFRPVAVVDFRPVADSRLGAVVHCHPVAGVFRPVVFRHSRPEVPSHRSHPEVRFHRSHPTARFRLALFRPLLTHPTVRTEAAIHPGLSR
jgi:hypothetical protein